MSEQSEQAIPAATLVIFRKGRDGPEPELLMVIRSKDMRFAGGAAVFPGGRVDPADYDLATTLTDNSGGDIDDLAHRIAAIRETLEETGLAIGLTGDMNAERAASARAMLEDRGALAPVLGAFDLTLDCDALVPFARWLPTGLKHSRIFDTRFYLADLGTGAVDVTIDATENTRLFWVSASRALAMADAGEIAIIFPTRRNLERLAQFPDFAAAQTHAEATPLRTITPQIDDTGPQPVLRIPENAGYPVTSEAITSALRG